MKVLGNGLQKKSYLHVEDCIDAILLAFKASNNKVNLFNLGVNDYCEVNDSIGWICSELGLKPKIHYSGGDRVGLAITLSFILILKELQSWVGLQIIPSKMALLAL